MRRAAGDVTGANADIERYFAPFTQAIEANEEDSTAWSARGAAQFQLERWELALADFSHATRVALRYKAAVE